MPRAPTVTPRAPNVRAPNVRAPAALAVAALLGALLAPPLSPAALADGVSVRLERPARHHRPAARRARPPGVALPAYALGPYCRHFATLGTPASDRGHGVVLCAAYEGEVRRDLAYRWHRLPVALRRDCVLAAARPRDRAYTVLNGCLDERRLAAGAPPGGGAAGGGAAGAIGPDLPALVPGGGLFR